MGSKLPLIIGGCVVLLLVCCVGVGIVVLVEKDTLSQALGMAKSAESLAPLAGNDNGSGPSADMTSAPSDDNSSSGAATAVPPSSGGNSSQSGGNPFQNALAKAKGATKYRVEFSMVFGGMQNGKYQESPLISFSGVVDGNKSDVTMNGGLLSSLYTGKVEMLDADGKEYIKGASSMMGMIKLDPNTWYISSEKGASSFRDFAKPDEFSTWTGGSKLSDFQKVRSESLDGQSCDIYLYDMKSIQNAALVGLLGSSQSKANFDSVDKAAINLWVCGDGYMHKYNLDYEGHSSADPNQKSAMKMIWHVWDVNNSGISVQAPSNAKPMPTQ